MDAIAIPCPVCGYKRVNRAEVRLGKGIRAGQVSKIVRPQACLIDDFGSWHPPGALQKKDLSEVEELFHFPHFVFQTFEKHKDTFRYSQGHIYQFQRVSPSGRAMVFGIVITDGSHNLVDYWCNSFRQFRNRAVMQSIIRAMCTRESIAVRFFKGKPTYVE